jgi:hypothetical protein
VLCDEHRLFWRISYGQTVNAEPASEIVGLGTSVIVIATLEPLDPKEATEPAVPATDGMNVQLLESNVALSLRAPLVAQEVFRS